MTGGKGGGRPDLAQAGGKDLSKLGNCIKTLSESTVKIVQIVG